MKYILFGIGILLMAVGCGPETDSLQPILRSGKAHFRGNSIGNNYKNVLKNATKDGVVQKDENLILSEFRAGESEVVVGYEFDQKKLYSIQADVFFADSIKLREFQDALMIRYDNSYGKVNEEGGFLTWRNRGSSGVEVEFALADESIEFGRPKISLTIYNFGY